MYAFGNRFFIVQETQFGGTVHASELWNFFRVRSRKQESALQLGQLPDDGSHFFLESEFQTFVEFIDNQSLHGRSIEILLAQVVVHTTGRADDDGRLDTFHGAVFFHGRSTTIATHHLVRSVHALEYLVNLQGQFSGRNEHHRLNSFFFWVQ